MNAKDKNFSDIFFTLNYKGADINFPKDQFNEADVLAGKQQYKVHIKDNGFCFAIPLHKSLTHAPASLNVKPTLADLKSILGL